MKHILTSLFLIAATSTASFAAETRTLTHGDVLSIAAARNLDVRKAEEYGKWVEGKYVEERSAALPQLSASTGISRSNDASLGFAAGTPRSAGGAGSTDASSGSTAGTPTGASRAGAGVTFSQPLYTWGKVGAAIRAAKGGFSTVGDQIRTAKQGAMREAGSVFFDVLLAKEMQRLADHNLKQKERHLDEAKRKHEAGVATDYDILAATVSVENARPDVIRAENRIRTTRDRLRYALNLQEEVDCSGTLEAGTEPVPPYEEALAEAIRNRPELSEVKNRKKIADELIVVAESGDKPRVDVNGGYGWNVVDVGPATARGPAWNVGLTVSFPFFDGLKTRGRVAQAESDRRTLDLEEAKLLDQVALQVREMRQAVLEAEQIAAGSAGTVRQAERLLEMAEQGYGFGVKTRLEVEDAEVNLLQAKINLASAQRDLRTARMNLQWAMGRL